MASTIAVTRPVSPSIVRCELTHLARQPIDVPRAAAQHAAYQELLRSLGATVVEAPAAPDLPDAVFVEDAAIVLDEIAVIARPGAASRRAETAAIASVLATYRPLHSITAPATLDGGDVLRLGRTLYVGRSARTREDGIDQLRRIATPFGYEVDAVDFTGCLHLKSAVTAIGAELLLVNPEWVDSTAFPGHASLAVDHAEPHAANALLLHGTVVFPSQYPRTLERLTRRGLRVATVDSSELARAEGGLTCGSLIFEA